MINKTIDSKKTICVFCSSSDEVDSVYFKEAAELGKMLAANGYNLVHGGGQIGLMGKLANAVQENGGKVTGVLPELLNIEGIASETDDEIIITRDMADRKNEMRKRADAFIALPGGFGTLEEILEVITLKQLKYHTKPVVFINTENYYGHLLEMFETIYSKYFAKDDYRALYFVASNAGEAIDYINNYKYVETKDKWFFKNLLD